MVDGYLEKLKITPFLQGEGVQSSLPGGAPFLVQFNPESFSVKNDVKLNSGQVATGATAKEAKQVSIPPREFNFDFLLDGTGASGPSPDVTVQIKLFEKTTGFTGQTHRNHFLVLQWGQFVVSCVLKSFTIKYTLFRPNGTPLRANLSAVFVEHKPKQQQNLENNLKSPDVTHTHRVQGDEHLATLCHQYYRDPTLYYRVAAANQLNNLRQIRAADELLFPPVEGKR
ncbi:hypothetical protein [Corallincola spongiicola]|uniref:Contractile injection system tube protein N-terminal domain-containing protein n=1 Tax=Corallincola spongiicola TaxID=2520508 RepID=A0ABY1WV23_9GAMM|nr:hypothetical protein [Corallincola spongiicola]TAA48436.1 hypothetical protein EXY25_04225 [Corallincola spongiicola]